jgi:Flp pilus assembly pilin Flp
MKKNKTSKERMSSFNSMNRLKSERGFTLLEYCAGATIIAVTVYGALTVLGSNFQSYLDSLGGWLVERGSSLQTSTTTNQQ